eukprot:6178931-Pleurochrysis_carterae.AAC.1
MLSLRASAALHVGPLGPIWHLTALECALPQGSGGGRHTACPSFGMKPKICTFVATHRCMPKKQDEVLDSHLCEPTRKENLFSFKEQA